MTERIRDKKGRLIRTTDHKKDMSLRSNAAKEMHGFDKKTDYVGKLLTVTEKAMTKLGTKRAENAYKSLSSNFQSDFAEIYSPTQNFIDEDASGGDDYAEGGRVPLDQLVAMSQFRVGWAYRATFGQARDIYRNGYDFIPLDANEETKPKKQPEITKWQDSVDFFSFRVNHLFRDFQTGLGIGVPIWKGEKDADLGKEIDITKKKDRPIKLKAFSAWHLAPANMLQYQFGDYDKSKWDFRGGINSTLFNHSRVTLLETRPEPFHLRGLSRIEPIWTPAICYFNLMIFILKAFAQVGVMSVGIKSPNEIPTKNEAKAYLDLLNDYRANKFYLLGQGAELITNNMASQIGRGVQEVFEVLKEDISACLVMPKNQLFGRSDGGGLDGAGALVSKDDWLAGLMADADDLTSEELKFLRGPCKFEKHLEGYTLRWRLDKHKTEMERLEEEAMRMDIEMKRQMKVQAEKQMKMNGILLDEQMKQAKADPKGFLDKMNTETEQKTEGGVKNKPEGGAPKPKQASKNDFAPRKIDYPFTPPRTIVNMVKPRKIDEDL